jgi:DUF4097 and DUF4098 domain-containing protein YvlB
MKFHFQFAAALLIAALAGGASAAEVTRTLKAELPPGAEEDFGIENLAGSMHVRPGSGPGVTATATIHAEDEALADKVRFEKVKGSRGEPVLRVVYPVGWNTTFRYPHGATAGESRGALSELFCFNDRIEYGGRRVRVSSSSGPLLYANVEVSLPARPVEGRFRNVVGPLRGEKVQGTLVFDSNSGDVTLSELRGEITADTGSGNVKMTDIEGSAVCDTGSGDCILSNVRGERVSCDTGSGNVILDSVRARARIEMDTGSGDVKATDVEATDAEGTISCDTGSGDCDLSDVRAERVICDTGSGNVTLRRVAAASVSVDTGSGDVAVSGADAREISADTGSGEVRVETAGGRLARLVADTGSGGVILRLGSDASFELHADTGSGDIVSHYADAQPILEDRQLVGFRRGDGRIRITVGTGSGDLLIEPGAAVEPAARKPRAKPR